MNKPSEHFPLLKIGSIVYNPSTNSWGKIKSVWYREGFDKVLKVDDYGDAIEEEYYPSYYYYKIYFPKPDFCRYKSGRLRLACLSIECSEVRMGVKTNPEISNEMKLALAEI